MSYAHLTIEERCCLREYYNKGYSYRKIAELLGRNVSTISREINRNKTYILHSFPSRKQRYLKRNDLFYQRKQKINQHTIYRRKKIKGK